MKNTSSLIYIDMEKFVKDRISEADIRDAERIENDPKKILALIDIIFMYQDRQKIIPS